MFSPRRSTATRAAAFAAASVLALAGCGLDISDLEDPKPSSSDSPSAGGDGEGTPLGEALEQLEVAEEKRDGYDRRLFKHWTDADGDGCDTRREVLIAEAVSPPEQGDRCAISGGEWLSYYDGETVTDAAKLDIDHMVPLAEAWDSGAHSWDDDRRERFANDLDADASLVAVTARSNRSKGDKDPAEWLPPAKDTHCTYAAEWVGTKLRWKLSVDTAEKAALGTLADSCTDTAVAIEPAP
ncbi:HNH endonuclease family protein [Streptomyces sp. 549]|uniref:HNH endonuclease family protein n=1 Tax=Streptomyces sp. 549 TaxID=3049076 RepID=UPI0024C2C603|nr:HNH endonuclease family protein [Streptomyces sp. 549]MDK1474612.1 HNH endonuclease family protein [Streptomyces sp. 549]